MKRDHDCAACGGVGKNSNGNPCVPCQRNGSVMAKKKRRKKRNLTSTKKLPTITAQCATIESGCPWIADDSIDLAVFSPPYFDRDGATPTMFHELGKLLSRVLKPGARAFCVVGQISEDFARVYEMFRNICDGASRSGRYLHPWQTIAWVKSIAIHDKQIGHYQPINSNNILNYGWETIFHFSNGMPEHARPLDRLSVGVPFADKSNLDRGSRGKNGDLHCAGDAWFIPYSTTGKSKKKAHRHSYPAELVERCIKVAGLEPNSTVLDPFIGGGTTADVAVSMGHSVVAVDADKDNIKALMAGYPADWAAAQEPVPAEPAAPVDVEVPALNKHVNRKLAARRRKRVSASDGFA